MILYMGLTNSHQFTLICIWASLQYGDLLVDVHFLSSLSSPSQTAYTHTKAEYTHIMGTNTLDDQSNYE